MWGAKMKIIVSEVAGTDCITMDDGQKVYDLIHPELQQHHTVELDFDGVELCASPFLNVALGMLYEDVASEDIHALLTFANLDPIWRHVLNMVIENAQAYYSTPEEERNRQDDMIGSGPEGE